MTLLWVAMMRSSIGSKMRGVCKAESSEYARAKQARERQPYERDERTLFLST